MNSIKELPDLFVELLEAVDTRTGIPKFPKRATELVREISAWAKTTRFYADHAQEARGFWEAGAEPEEIWAVMLHKVVHAPTALHRDASVIGHMPALERALDEQRRCRVCGCTERNACPGGCYWVEWDLCSECAGKEEEPPHE